MPTAWNEADDPEDAGHPNMGNLALLETRDEVGQEPLRSVPNDVGIDVAVLVGQDVAQRAQASPIVRRGVTRSLREAAGGLADVEQPFQRKAASSSQSQCVRGFADPNPAPMWAGHVCPIMDHAGTAQAKGAHWPRTFHRHDFQQGTTMVGLAMAVTPEDAILQVLRKGVFSTKDAATRAHVPLKKAQAFVDKLRSEGRISMRILKADAHAAVVGYTARVPTRKRFLTM